MSTRRAETSGESRRRLLDAAERLFAERGYAQTSVADIADRAGISRGSIPWHFGSKEGLLLAVIEAAADRFGRAFSPAGTHSVTSAEHFLCEVADMLAGRSASVLLSVFIDALDPESAGHDRYAHFQERARSDIAAWARGRDFFSIGVSPDEIALIVVAAALGIQAQHAIAPDRVDLRATFVALARLLDAVGDTAGPALPAPATTNKETP